MPPIEEAGEKKKGTPAARKMHETTARQSIKTKEHEAGTEHGIAAKKTSAGWTPTNNKGKRLLRS